MKTSILVDDKELPLNPFISGLVGNVVKGLVASLKDVAKEPKAIEFRLQGQDVSALTVDGQPVSLQMTSGFAQQVVGSTLRGMLAPLKGIEEAAPVVIRVERI